MKLIFTFLLLTLFSCGNTKVGNSETPVEKPKYFEFQSDGFVEDYYFNAPDGGKLKMFRSNSVASTLDVIDHSSLGDIDINPVDYIQNGDLIYYRLNGTIWELDTVTNQTALKIINSGDGKILNHFFIDGKYYYVERLVFYKKIIEYDLVNDIILNEYNVGQSYHIGKIKISKYNNSLYVVNDKIYEIDLATNLVTIKDYKNANHDLYIQDAIIAVDKIVYKGRLNNGFVIATYDMVSELYSYVYQNSYQNYTHLTRKDNKVFYYYSDSQNRIRIKYLDLNNDSDNNLVNAWTDGYVAINSYPAKPIVVGNWLYYMTTSGDDRLKKYDLENDLAMTEFIVDVGGNPSLGFWEGNSSKGFISYSNGSFRGNGIIVTDNGSITKFYGTDDYKITPLVLTNSGVLVKEENLITKIRSIKILNEDLTYQMLRNNVNYGASNNKELVFSYKTTIPL